MLGWFSYCCVWVLLAGDCLVLLLLFVCIVDVFALSLRFG